MDKEGYKYLGVRQLDKKTMNKEMKKSIKMSTYIKSVKLMCELNLNGRNFITKHGCWG